MSSEVITILTAGIAAAAGLLGTGIGALVTYLTMRKQVEVSMQVIQTQADIAKSERASRFALAALEKRLDVHQKAYCHWANLYRNWHETNVSDIALQCQEFWYDNCLYLDPNSRSSFKKILFHAGTFQSYDCEMKTKVFNQLEDVGRHLTEGVDLRFMQHKFETTRIEDVQQGRAADVLKAAADV